MSMEFHLCGPCILSAFEFCGLQPILIVPCITLQTGGKSNGVSAHFPHIFIIEKNSSDLDHYIVEIKSVTKKVNENFVFKHGKWDG